MSFKIGDKVKIIKFPEKNCIGMICEVIEISDHFTDYVCRIKQVSTYWECLMKPDEIDKIPTKGQQLLFSFIEQ